MHRFRHGETERERPGTIDAAGTMRDLSSILSDIDGEVPLPERLAALANVDLGNLPTVDPSTRLGCCLARSGKFVCIGLDYRDNAETLGLARPGEPPITIKPLSAVCGPTDDIQLPRGSVATDWEVELGTVIGRRARYLRDGEGLAHVAGYCLLNDVAERDLQSKRDGDTSKGRGHDSFGPIGPWLVTRDEVTDPQDIRLWLDIGGERVQSGWTGDMFVGVDKLVVYLSGFMTLLPGDVVATGTPAGIGVGRSLPSFLRPRQTVRLGGDGLGEQTHRVTVPFEALALHDTRGI